MVAAAQAGGQMPRRKTPREVGEISRQTISVAGFDVTRARSMSMVESPTVCDAVNLKLLSVVVALTSWQLQIRNRPSMIGRGEPSNG